MKVLIAEDDTTTRTILDALLKKWGYSTQQAPDGTTAMMLIRGNEAAPLLLLDWMMPTLDGIEICKRIRERGNTAYIILLTSKYQKENLVEGLEAGADDYISKPFD